MSNLLVLGVVVGYEPHVASLTGSWAAAPRRWRPAKAPASRCMPSIAHRPDVNANELALAFVRGESEEEAEAHRRGFREAARLATGGLARCARR